MEELARLEKTLEADSRARSACSALLEWSWQHPYSTALNYAHDYARWATLCPAEELPAQLMYVLANITHWRGATATSVRAELKECMVIYQNN